MNKVEQKIAKLEHNVISKRTKIRQLEKEIEELYKLKFKQSQILTRRSEVKRKKCKHSIEYGRDKHPNCRDDASFPTWVSCKRCGETLWDEIDLIKKQTTGWGCCGVSSSYG